MPTLTSAATGRLYAEGRVGLDACAWSSSPGTTQRFGQLQGLRKFDVAIVGAGLAGASLALHLAESGVSVGLIEACEPGWGASGRNAGNVSACRELLPQIRKLPDGGERFLSLLKQHADYPFVLANRHAIDCDAVQGGALRVARRVAEMRLVEQKIARWSQLGMKVRYVDREETAYLTGSRRYFAGALDESGGRINPYRFSNGLAAAAQKAGASVFGHSAATKIVRQSGRWKIETAMGASLSEQVVLCTGAYGAKLEPAIDRALTPMIAYGLATRPLPEHVRSSILPLGGTFFEMSGFHATLIDGRGRLVTSLLPGASAQDSGAPLADLRRWFSRTYPRHGDFDLELDTYWTGRIAYSRDELPRIYELGPGLLALNGLSTGNVYGPLLGLNLARALVAGSRAELVLPVTTPEPSCLRQTMAQAVVRYAFVPLMRALERAGL